MLGKLWFGLEHDDVYQHEGGVDRKNVLFPWTNCDHYLANSVSLNYTREINIGHSVWNEYDVIWAPTVYILAWQIETSVAISYPNYYKVVPPKL